jgi:hypothetical protein
MESIKSVLSSFLPWQRGRNRRVAGVVGDGAGASGARASVIIVDAGVGEVVDADRICASFVVVTTKSLEPVV